MRYPVILTRDDNDTFVVTFPDVSEAITYGDTREEALARAPDALLTIFDAFMRDRRDLPPPSPTAAGDAIELPALETAKLALYRAMRAARVNKSELARRLKWHTPQVDRVLNVRHASQFAQVEAALGVLGKRLTVGVEDVARPTTVRTRLAKKRPAGRTFAQAAAQSKSSSPKPSTRPATSTKAPRRRHAAAHTS